MIPFSSTPVARRRAAWLAAAILLVLIFAAWRSWRGAEVESARVVRGPIVQSVVATGRIAAPARIELGAQQTARVAQVRVREGETVKAGQVLIELDGDEARAALAQARAGLTEAQARMVQLAQVGAPVARDSLRQAQAQLVQARNEFERVKSLTDKGFFSGSRLDEAERSVKTAAAAESAARAQAEAQREGGAEHALAQARLEQARAALALAEARLANLSIKAPVDGTVTLREVEPGDVAQAGKRLMEMVAAGETRIHANVDEKNLRHLAVGQGASAVADAYPGQSFEAKLYYIAPAVDPARGTVEVRLRVPQAPSFLRPDMTASVELVAARKDASLIIPAEAVREIETSPWVMVERSGRAVKVPVKLGVRGTGQVELLDGPEQGEAVLLAPVSEGARVSVREGKRL